METWSFYTSCLGEQIYYQYDINNVIHINNYDHKYEWMNVNTDEIVIIKGTTLKTNEEVISVHIYCQRKRPYRVKGTYQVSKSYYMYKGEFYSKDEKIKSIPKEVKMALKEKGINYINI